MKKSNLLLALSMTVLLGFTGCSKQVKLETGVGNVSDIKSCSYDMTVSVDTTGLKNKGLDAGADSAVSSLLTAGKVSLNFNGKMLNKDDRSKISSNVKVSASGVSFEAPIYIDSSTKKLDFDLFVGVPDILKNMLGDTLTNVSNLHLASKDLESYVKKNSTAAEYKTFEESLTKMFDPKSSKNSQVSKDMLLSFNSYLTKNKAKVETFAKLDKESTSKNGVYTIKLSKDDLKTIVADYLGNKTYFNNLQTAMKDAQAISSASSEEKVKPITEADSKTMITEFNKSLDELKTMDIVSTVTIENNFATKTNVKVSVADKDGVVAFEIDSKLSDINKVTSITAPDKNSDKTLDVMKLIEKLGLGGTTN